MNSISKSKAVAILFALSVFLFSSACDMILPTPGDEYIVSEEIAAAQERLKGNLGQGSNYEKDTSAKSAETLSVIFVAAGSESHAYVRAEVLAEKYGTATAVRIINTADDFITQWNDTFSLFNAQGVAIDAIEIISHGNANDAPVGRDSNGTPFATGCLYFEDPNDNNRRTNVYARDIANMESIHRSLSSIYVYVTAKEFNINACNSANPDIYNMVNGFMQITSVKIFTGWDGGTIWDSKTKDYKRGGGDYAWWVPWDPWYSVKKNQETYWKYVEKNLDGSPARKRVGRLEFRGD